MEQKRIEDLPARWDVWAKNRFRDAGRYPKDSMERRFIEHGAMCYLNCVDELRKALKGEPLPEPSATPEER
jgi:hypothetical protein